jgi:hypothetical protein
MHVSMQMARQALPVEALSVEALCVEALSVEALPLDVGGDSSATLADLPRVESDTIVGSDALAGGAELERKTT